jgi:hypothetical protein
MMRRYGKQNRSMLDLTNQIPIGKESLQALFRHLEETIYRTDSIGETRSTCDCTLMRTEAFLRAMGLWSDAVRKWLERYGGYCDCEVVMNVGGYWRRHL